MTSNILVTGGTGKTGRKVVRGLLEKQQNVRVGSRTASPAFEWKDRSTWPEALHGMDMAYLSYYPDLAVPGAFEDIRDFAAEAKKAGLRKVVLLSGKGEKEAERCEQAVAESGLDYTLVRASWFNQNFSESFFLEPVRSGVVALPMPDARIPFVDTDDIAAVVVEALLDDSHNGNTYEVTGPRTMTFGEVTREIAEATGRNIKYQAITQEEYNAMMTAAGVPSDVVWLLDYLFRDVLRKPENQAITRDVERVLGRPATDFRTFARQAARSGIWQPVVPQTI